MHANANNDMLQSDLDAQDLAGNTPLHLAVENDSLEALEYLLSMYVYCTFISLCSYI